MMIYHLKFKMMFLVKCSKLAHASLPTNDNFAYFYFYTEHKPFFLKHRISLTKDYRLLSLWRIYIMFLSVIFIYYGIYVCT